MLANNFRVAASMATRSQPMLGLQTRTMLSIANASRTEVRDRVKSLRCEIHGSNWADYLEVVQNVPFWEAERAELQNLTKGYLDDPEIGPEWAAVHDVFDCMYQCEDVRDHINELNEVLTRSSGLMGTGYFAGARPSNLDEHVARLDKEYVALKKKWAQKGLMPKVELTVGHGLAIMRQKQKFDFAGRFRFFF